jgi:hypothetical protein
MDSKVSEKLTEEVEDVREVGATTAVTILKKFPVGGRGNVPGTIPF